jgi:carboxyl-terminal processing protease
MPYALFEAVASCVAVLAGQIASGEPVGPKSEDRQITRNITGLMSREHLTRHPLDNEISNRWLTNYLKMLDPRKVFFSQADVDGFRLPRQLDDGVKGVPFLIGFQQVPGADRPSRQDGR